MHNYKRFFPSCPVRQFCLRCLSFAASLDSSRHQAVLVAREVVQCVEFLRYPPAVKEIRLSQRPNDLADQQIVRLHLEYLHDPAFQMAGTLGDQRWLDRPGGNRCQAAFFELIDAPSCYTPHVVRLFEQFFAGNVYGQLVILLYQLVRIPDMTDSKQYQARIGVVDRR